MSPQPSEYNCDIFVDVDFGHGPVEVRCTQKGDHIDHKCEVFIHMNRDLIRRNIFKENDGSQDT